jgi:hypothetical protein
VTVSTAVLVILVIGNLYGWWHAWRRADAWLRRRFRARDAVPAAPGGESFNDPGGLTTGELHGRRDGGASPLAGAGGERPGMGAFTARDRRHLDMLIEYLPGLPDYARYNGCRLADRLRMDSDADDALIARHLLTVRDYAAAVDDACIADGHEAERFFILTDALGVAAVDLTAVERCDERLLPGG